MLDVAGHVSGIIVEGLGAILLVDVAVPLVSTCHLRYLICCGNYTLDTGFVCCVHFYVVALSSRMSGFVLTNRSANIFGNIQYLFWGGMPRIYVSRVKIDLYMLNLSQYLHAFLIQYATTPEKFMYVQGFPIRKPPSRGKVHAALLGDQPCYSEARDPRKKIRRGKYMEGIPKFGWHQLYKTTCLSNSNVWFVGDFFRMRWLENCKTSGLIWTRWWFVGEVGFRYGSLGSGLLGKEPMFS